MKVIKENGVPFAVLLSIVLAVFVANPYVISDLASYSFDDGTYSHAYLIPFIMAYVVIEGAKQGELVVRWQPFYLISLIVCALIFLWMQVAQIPLAFRFFLPLVVFFALASMLRVTSAIIVFSALIWFITPIWGPLTSILQYVSVIAVTEIMSWTHIPAYVEGNTVYIAVGAFEIANGCSGLRYFITSMALCLIYSYLNFTKARNIVIFTLITIIGALITNWIRIVVIIFIGHYSEMQSPIVEDHNSLGWYIFIPFILALFYFGGKLEQPFKRAALRKTPVSLVKPTQFLAIILVIFGLSTLTVNGLSGASTIWSVNVIDEISPAQSTELSDTAPVIQRFSAVDTTRSSSGQLRHRFSFNGESSEQRPDYFFNQLLPDGFVQVTRDNYPSFGIIEVVNTKNESFVIRFQYEVADQTTASELQYKLLRLKAALSLDRTSFLNWLIVPCQSNCTALKTQLEYPN